MNMVQSDQSGNDVVIRELGRGETARFVSDLFLLLSQLRPGLTRQMFCELTSDGYEQGLRFLIAHPVRGPRLLRPAIASSRRAGAGSCTSMTWSLLKRNGRAESQPPC